MKVWALPILAVVALASQSGKQPETAKFKVDYREVMISMRDGVRLQTVIISPKDAKEPLPILLRRTPYGVPDKEAAEEALATDPDAGKWIRVAQNIRGRFGSR